MEVDERWLLNWTPESNTASGSALFATTLGTDFTAKINANAIVCVKDWVRRTPTFGQRVWRAASVCLFIHLSLDASRKMKPGSVMMASLLGQPSDLSET